MVVLAAIHGVGDGAGEEDGRVTVDRREGQGNSTVRGKNAHREVYIVTAGAQAISSIFDFFLFTSLS